MQHYSSNCGTKTLSLQVFVSKVLEHELVSTNASIFERKGILKYYYNN